MPNASSNLLVQTMATGLILAGYPAAKQQLIDSGMDAAKVEAMPVGQVVAIQSARAYRKVYQESMKWTLLPYWQSYRQMRATFADLRGRGFFGKPGDMPACHTDCRLCCCPPSNQPHLLRFACNARSLRLQTIEALRMVGRQ